MSSNSSVLPLVSVVVPVYNGEADLPELISCLCSQTYPPERVEYLLVDNNSQDSTSTILETAGKKFNCLAYHHITEKKIQSSYAARNRGIQRAKGDVIAFTDADCRPNSDWLEQLIKPFGDPNIGIVAGEIMGLPGNTLCEKYAEVENLLFQKHTLSHPFCPYGQTANLAIIRQAFVKVGLFRPYLDTGGDADICWRILQQTKLQIQSAPQAIIRHRYRSQLSALRNQWRRYGCSHRYLHQLYGVDLTRDLNQKEIVYRLSRWLLKELPLSSIKAMMGKANFIDLIKTPIDLICSQALCLGQRESQLPEEARQIEFL